MDQAVIDQAINALSNLGDEKNFSTGQVLVHEGQPSDGIFLIVAGCVESFDFDEDLQMATPLYRFFPGQLAGVLVSSSIPATESIRAMVDTKAVCITWEVQQALVSGQHPNASDYIQILQHTLLGHSQQVRATSQPEPTTSPIVDAIVKRAVIAQTSLQHIEEALIDDLIHDIAEVVSKQAWELADAAVTETGMGVVTHRVQKIMLGTLEVASSICGQPGSGALVLESPSVESMSVPMGVILGLIPVTNPVETLVFKVLIALKSRNAIVLSCHHKAKQVSARVVRIIREVLARYELNPDLVQTPDLPSKRTLTRLLMSHDDISFILATGGTNMVKAAYQSGTPSIGVGKGNAPVWVCADADVNKVAQQVVESKSFDNGIVCGSENNLLVDDSVYQKFVDQLEAAGAAVLTEKEADLLINSVFSLGVTGKLNDQWVGKSAQDIARHAGIKRASQIKLLVVPHATENFESPLVREKLAPIVSLLRVQDVNQALQCARTILSMEGRGHTAIIHTEDQDRVEAFARASDVCRVLVNSPGTQGCIGACNGLELSWTLGCGTAGGSSTSDNVTFRHLQNTKRIARPGQLPKAG